MAQNKHPFLTIPGRAPGLTAKMFTHALILYNIGVLVQDALTVTAPIQGKKLSMGWQ